DQDELADTALRVGAVPEFRVVREPVGDDFELVQSAGGAEALLPLRRVLRDGRIGGDDSQGHGKGGEGEIRMAGHGGPSVFKLADDGRQVSGASRAVFSPVHGASRGAV